MKVRTQTTIAALLLVSACNEWVHVETPQEALMRAKARTVQVTKTDRTVLLLRDATLVRDTLVGTDARDGSLRATPLSDITSMDIRQFSPVLTTLLVVGGAVAVLVTAAILVATSQPWQF